MHRPDLFVSGRMSFTDGIMKLATQTERIANTLESGGAGEQQSPPLKKHAPTQVATTTEFETVMLVQHVDMDGHIRMSKTYQGSQLIGNADKVSYVMGLMQGEVVSATQSSVPRSNNSGWDGDSVITTRWVIKKTAIKADME
jgi:hypothetical protein